MDKTLRDLESVLLKALNERGLDPDTLIKCKDLLSQIIEKAASSVKEEGEDRESIKKAVYDLLSKKAGTISAT